MPLRFNERGPAVDGNLLLAVLLAISLACFIVYVAEGEGGPLHGIQHVTGTVTSPIRAAGDGIQSAQSAAQTTLDDLNANPETLSELREQNEQLRQMVSELEEYRQTAQRLESIQNMRDLYAMEGVTCRVTGRSSDAWNRVVTIDKGSNDGITAGLPVMGASGLVGQVKNVGPNTSEVRLLQDPNSGVAVILQSNRAEGLLKGNIDGLLYLEDVDGETEVKPGDMVITSGVGGGYFRGLLVGTVVRVEATNGQSIRQIVVSPNDTIASLEEVMVVTGMSSEGALSANANNAAAANAQQGASSSASSASGEEGSSGDSGGAEGTEAAGVDAASAETGQDEEV